MLLDDLRTGALCPDGELLRGSGPEGVPRAEEDLLPLPLQTGPQLADGGGLSYSVDTDEEDHGGFGVQLQALVAHGEHLLKDPAQTGADALLILDLLALDPAFELLHRLERGIHPHIGQNEGLLQLVIKIIVNGGKAGKNVQLFDLIKKSHFLPSFSLIFPRNGGSTGYFPRHFRFSSCSTSLRLMVSSRLIPCSCMVTP